MKEILEVIRVQRHDFLNHLQVISGLLQLKKPEKALDYIKQISHLIGHESQISRLSNLDLATRLLIEKNRAAQLGAEFDIVVLEFSEIAMPDALVADHILQVVRNILNHCRDSADYCHLRLAGDERFCWAELEFPYEKLVYVEECLREVQAGLIQFGGQLICTKTEEACQVRLNMPKVQVCVG